MKNATASNVQSARHKMDRRCLSATLTALLNQVSARICQHHFKEESDSDGRNRGDLTDTVARQCQDRVRGCHSTSKIWQNSMASGW
jgi:hypothetical protein